MAYKIKNPKPKEKIESRDIYLEKLKEKLPHGSGINGDWNIYYDKKNIVATNIYSAMNEAGYYDADIPFKLIIPKDNQANFKLHFDSNYQYYVKKYQLRDYLEETFAEALK